MEPNVKRQRGERDTGTVLCVCVCVCGQQPVNLREREWRQDDLWISWHTYTILYSIYDDKQQQTRCYSQTWRLSSAFWTHSSHSARIHTRGTCVEPCIFSLISLMWKKCASCNWFVFSVSPMSSVSSFQVAWGKICDTSVCGAQRTR